MDDLVAPTVYGSTISPTAETAPAAPASQAPLRLRELISLLLMVLCADLCLYRGEGDAGWAALFVSAPTLLLLSAPRSSMPSRKFHASLPTVAILLAIVAGKLVWCGSPLAVAAGIALLPIFVLGLGGRTPYLGDALALTVALTVQAGRGIAVYIRQLQPALRRFGAVTGFAYVLPAIVGLAFCGVFVLANPDVVTFINRKCTWLLNLIDDWLIRISISEAFFLLAAAWIAIGLLRPRLPRARQTVPADGMDSFLNESHPSSANDPLFVAWRNTLQVVIAIYAAYLCFELGTLWFRAFPKGFPYSGYAHEGAAWLTVALALATTLLSIIFRGSLLSDPRVKRLERLAWSWSALNLLLAIAVYHRLAIYVNFNGMTRMRIVGIYGVTAVVVGFVLVLVKIVRRRGFGWLVQRHLWTLALAIYFYAVTPSDWLAMRYNVSRILAGTPAPSVQITVQPISAEGLLALQPLLNDSDPIVRDGVAALLEEGRDQLEASSTLSPHWTRFQLAERRFLASGLPNASKVFSRSTARAQAWKRFQTYAYQWY